MALRSRSRTAAATSGPGREPASDSRVRHRRPPGRGHTRQRRAPAEDLRRRAEALLARHGGEESRHACDGRQRADPGSESGAGPPPGVTRTAGTGHPGSPAPTDTGTGPVAPAAGSWRARAGVALRERMPLWVQARCGLERRSVIALAVLLAAAVAFAAQHFWTGRTRPVRAPEVVRAATAPYGTEHTGDTSAPAGTPAGNGPDHALGPGAGAGRPGGAQNGAPGAVAGAEIVVDVAGKVRRPGIHRLPAGSRVADALDAAGGVRPGTDLTGLNRARFLADGEQVIVGAPAPVTGTGAGTPPGGPMVPAVPVAPVPLNTATVDQLDTLPGVGPVLARHIVDYRTRHGGFRSVDELREVNGIGERRFADLRNLVRP
ncbi:ComEA family DNA-binding protein [Streptomyces sp. MUM 2J]|uniref:ComEA family DNA-binding protein n=1 Tax=Streptomyces sp. MUM 2J TaxID=2791987 RepID=UPI001F036461|nr:ComEA family DNA-binding protein [Streptomyces sp. MUM 2J]MCH0565445.1 ComEA family DNA-binding protein [Streptomyces sp. MUM 2J]